MAQPTPLRLLQGIRPSITAACRARPFTSTAIPLARIPNTQNPASDPLNFNKQSTNIERTRQPGQRFAPASPTNFGSIIPNRDPNDPLSNIQNLTSAQSSLSNLSTLPTHHFHIYATKHNTHITLTTPDMDPLISVSCGNIGFRKAGRSTYDAAYQLAAFVMSRIQDKGLLPQIQRLEVVYRGFGAGREAVTKAILGSEGRRIRGLIVGLRDCTRLKFGGTRSPRPRRLG